MKKLNKIDFTEWIVNNHDSPLKTIYYELQIIRNWLPNLQEFIIAIDAYFYSLQNEIKEISVMIPNVKYDNDKIEKYKPKALNRLKVLIKEYDLIEITTYYAICIFLIKQYIHNNRTYIINLENEKSNKPYLAAFRIEDELYYSNLINCFEYCIINIEQKYYEHKNELPFEILDEFIDGINFKNIIYKNSIKIETHKDIVTITEEKNKINRKQNQHVSFEHNFSDNQLQSILELSNKIKLFNTTINFDTIYQIFNCTLNESIKVSSNIVLAHLFDELAKRKFICSQWQNTISKNKLFQGKKDAFITNKNLSASLQKVNINDTNIAYISNVISNL